MSGDELILEELQTQTEILQEIRNGYMEDKELVNGFFDIFPPLLFIYIVFGLFFSGK